MRRPLTSASALLLLAGVALAVPAAGQEPDFTFLEPQGLQDVTPGGPVRLRWDGSDPQKTLRLGLYLTRQAVSPLRPPQVEQDTRVNPDDLLLASAPPQLEWNTTGLAPGCYQPYAVLTGAESHHAVAPGKLTVRAPGFVPPAVWILNAREEQVDAYGRFVVRFRVSDPDSTTTVSLKYGNGTDVFELAQGLTFPPGGGEGRWEADVSALPRGAYELYARVEAQGEPACETYWSETLFVPGGGYMHQKALVCEPDPPDAGEPPPPPPPPSGGGTPEEPAPPPPAVQARPFGCTAAPGGSLLPVLPLLWHWARRRRRSAGRKSLPGAFALLLLAPAARAQSSALVGEWTAVQPWPDTGTHLILLPGGKVLSWSETEPKDVSLWDPETGTHVSAALPGHNIFCAGHALLADGRLLVSGGHEDTNEGLPYASIYDPATDAWTRLPDMNDGRWYPTNTLLPDGDMLVIAGTATERRVGENRLPQVWEAATQRWRDLTDAQRTVDTYPWMFVAPNGKLFLAGPEQDTAYLDTAGSGAWTPVGRSHHGYRRWGSAVMYDAGKVLITGGGDVDNTDTAEVIDLEAPRPLWRGVQAMHRARKQHNLTLLPDGAVLVTGGSSGPGKTDEQSPALAAELWDPARETFSLLASSRVFRGYHSAALLLPDGRVLSVGGEKTRSMELFSPPYLFKGPRPTLASAPEAIGYGQSFRLQTPDALRIAKVTLLRPGSVTHAFNQSQRLHSLPFTRDALGLTVTAPADGVAAQPGAFMLFLVSEAGVPSVARWVRLGRDVPPPGEVSAGGDAPGADGGAAQPWTVASTSCSTSSTALPSLALLLALGGLLASRRRSPAACPVATRTSVKRGG